MKYTKNIFNTIIVLLTICTLMITAFLVTVFLNLIFNLDIYWFMFEVVANSTTDEFLAVFFMLCMFSVCVFAIYSSYKRLKLIKDMTDFATKVVQTDELPIDDVVEYVHNSIYNFKRNFFWVIQIIAFVVLSLAFSEYVFIDIFTFFLFGVIAALIAFVIRWIFDCIFESNASNYLEMLYRCKIHITEDKVVGTAFTRVPTLTSVYFSLNDLVEFSVSKPLNGTTESYETAFNFLSTGRTLVINTAGKKYVIPFLDSKKTAKLQRQLFEKTIKTTPSIPEPQAGSLQQKPVEKHFCPYCAAPIEKGAIFCGKCGQKH